MNTAEHKIKSPNAPHITKKYYIDVLDYFDRTLGIREPPTDKLPFGVKRIVYAGAVYVEEDIRQVNPIPFVKARAVLIHGQLGKKKNNPYLKYLSKAFRPYITRVDIYNQKEIEATLKNDKDKLKLFIRLIRESAAQKYIVAQKLKYSNKKSMYLVEKNAWCNYDKFTLNQLIKWEFVNLHGDKFDIALMGTRYIHTYLNQRNILCLD